MNVWQMAPAVPDWEPKFWAYVIKAGPDDCWTWTGTVCEKGYGLYHWRNGRHRRAHRLAYLLAHGHLPEDMSVCHTCDNPPCVNSAHLFLGTNADNTRDMMAKGRNNQPIGLRNGQHTKPDRRPRGERHGNAKVTWDQVQEMRRMYAAGTLPARLAERFGIHRSTVAFIVKGAHWTRP